MFEYLVRIYVCRMNLNRMERELPAGFYSETLARDGAMIQATTMVPKLTNATAIISRLLRLKLGTWVLRCLKFMYGVGSNQ